MLLTMTAHHARINASSSKNGIYNADNKSAPEKRGNPRYRKFCQEIVGNDKDDDVYDNIEKAERKEDERKAYDAEYRP